MFDMLKQAVRMREDMARLQTDLAGRTVEGGAGEGKVRVVANGKLQLLSVTIDPSLLASENKTKLEELVTAATNTALSAAQAMAAEELGKITAGLGPLANMLKGQS